MATEILDIIDTSIKIGLGAAIGGVTSYVMAGRQNRLENDKARLNDRKDLYIKMAENFEKLDEHIDRVAVEIRTISNNPNHEAQEFRFFASEIAEGFKYLSVARANANLLSLDELSADFKEYSSSVAVFLDQIEYFLDEGDVNLPIKAHQKINQLKESIYPKMQNGFDQLYA